MSAPPASLVQRWEERRWHYRRSLASRVTLLTTIAVGVTVAFVALGAYLTVRIQMQETLDKSLIERAHAAASAGVLSESSIPSSMVGAADIRIFIINENYEIRSLDELPVLPLGRPEHQVATGASSKSVRTLTYETRSYRVVTVPTNRSGQAMVLAQSLQNQNKVLDRLGLVMLLFGACGVIAAALAGWLVARNGLRPVRRLTASVERIARTEDLAPLPVEGDDELARLSVAFNSMLTSLASSRDLQRQLVADAGHELRTPLTSMRTNIDLLSMADSGGGLKPEARAELLADVRAQMEELTTLIGDLVELARDAPKQAAAVREVDLAEVLDHAVARVRRRAPRLDWQVTSQPWIVLGDQAGLERAVTNLLDNAAKWSPETGTVDVQLRGGVLTVDDEGPGITESDRPHVFDRFYRSAEARTMPGSGLGLAIVAQVAARHSGSVSVSASNSGGARLVFRVPGHKPADGPARA